MLSLGLAQEGFINDGPRSPRRPLVATQNDVRVLKHLSPPVLQYLYLTMRFFGKNLIIYNAINI
jgi:hypothetical protein